LISFYHYEQFMLASVWLNVHIMHFAENETKVQRWNESRSFADNQDG